MLNEKLLVRVLWGPRPETTEACAQRWARTISLLADVDSELLGEWFEARGRRPDQWLRLAEADLEPIVHRGAVQKSSGEVVADLGYLFDAFNGRRDDGAVEFRAAAGLFHRKSSQVNTARIEAWPRSPADVNRWRTLAGEVLAALVTAWEPDHGAAWTYALYTPQGVAPADPFAGYVTYLSAGRCAGLPDELPGAWRHTTDGGLIVTLLDGDTVPGPDEVVALGRALRATGALDPVPRDRPRM